jgi:CRP/FNR family nitrogen fixation transcriptional regulator
MQIAAAATTTTKAAVPGGIRPDEPSALRVPGRIIRIDRDAEVYAEGSSSDHVYRVISGAVRTCKLMPDGRRQVGEFALPGDLFGLDAIGAHFYAAEAATDTQLVCYSRRALEEHAARDYAIARAVQQVTLRNLVAAQKQMVLLGRKTALERVASFLREMHDRVGRAGGCLSLPMSRQDIADYLGLTIETVSRSLAMLKQRAVIALPDPHRVRILDLDSLECLKGEQDASIH